MLIIVSMEMKIVLQCFAVFFISCGAWGNIFLYMPRQVNIYYLS